MNEQHECLCISSYKIVIGGIFVDSAVHDLDLVCWLAGEEPRSIYATGGATNDLYKECNDLDSSVVVLNFGSGIVGIIENGREAPVGYFQHVEVRDFKTNKEPKYVIQKS